MRVLATEVLGFLYGVEAPGEACGARVIHLIRRVENQRGHELIVMKVSVVDGLIRSADGAVQNPMGRYHHEGMGLIGNGVEIVGVVYV
jgi:hypothetical protein